MRWLSPLPLWTGVLAGPAAWAADLSVSYALVKPACGGGSTLLHVVTALSLAVVSAAAVLSSAALGQTRGGGPTDGARPEQRARFMAILGLASSALFALAIFALEIPRWVLDACR